MNVREKSDEIRSFYQVADDLDMQVIEAAYGYRIDVEASNGRGFLYLSQIIPGFYLKVYDFRLDEDLQIELYEGKDDTLRINHISKGNILFQKANNQSSFQRVSKSNNLFVQTDRKHGITYRFPSGEHIQICSIVIEKTTLKNKKPLESSLLKNLLDSVISTPNLKSYVAQDDPASRSLASNIINSISTNAGSNLVTKGSVIMLLGFIISNIRESNIHTSVDPNQIKQSHIQTCLNMTEYISKSLAQKFIVAELAKEFEITVKNLQTCTKYIYGVSVAEHISNLRLSAARKMIQNTDQSINDIRKACGFNSFSYFSKQFNTKFGYSPKQYQYTFFKGTDIFELCYKSTSIDGLNELQIRNIVSTAIKHNKKNDITGCLVHHNQTFFQIIEGRKDRILILFDMIKRDDRHTDIEVLWQGSKKLRNFGLWNMALVTQDSDVKITYEHKNNDFNLSDIINESSDSKMVSNALWSKVRDRLIA